MTRSRLAGRLVLCVAFLAVQSWLTWGATHSTVKPLADVTGFYREWVRGGFSGAGWPAIDFPWVYPIGALVPMTAAAIGGTGQAYTATWVLTTVVFTLATMILIARVAGGSREVWWWLAFIALVGPVGIGRIDALSIDLAIVGGLLIVSRPAMGGALLTAAAWVKVWPAGLLLATLAVVRRRGRQIAGSVAVCAVVAAFAVATSSHHILSFASAQSSRGVQLESVIATPFLWLANTTGSYHPVWDTTLSSWEVRGPGLSLVAHLATPVLGLTVMALCGLGLRAHRRGIEVAAILGPLTLGVTTTLFAANKVGSAQYVGWLAAPVIIGMVCQRRGGPSFTVPALLALAAAGLTQLIFPWFYIQLVHLKVPMLIVITARNLLLLALVGVAIKDLLRPVSTVSVRSHNRREHRTTPVLDAVGPGADPLS